MIGNVLTSFFDNLSTKTRNPFLGTFTIVWLCRNWEVVFDLFNFGNSYSLESKIDFLSERVKYETFWSELGVNIIWTFFILIATYILINLARVVTNIFENRLTPWIYKITAPGKTRLASDFISLQEQFDKTFQSYQGERIARINAQTDRDEKQNNIEQLKNQISVLEGKIEDLRKNARQPNRTSKEESEKLKDDSPINETEFQEMVNEFSFKSMELVLVDILNGKTVNYNEQYDIIEEFLNKKLILLYKRGKDEFNNYMLTEKGKYLVNDYFTEH